MPKDCICNICSAPSKYLYYNDGKKRSQIKCKVCNSLSPLHPRHHEPKSNLFCPHCHSAIYLWKHRKDVSIYKCPNDNCSLYLKNKSKLNLREKLLAKIKSSQFKLRYQYREYHFTNEQLVHSAPRESSSIFSIHNSLNTLCLALTFHVSLGISARKTAFILKKVFSLPASYQTVLNYAGSAAYHCHKFNLVYKGDVDKTQAADETYIKVSGKTNYTFFGISAKKRKITSGSPQFSMGNLNSNLPAIR